MRDQYKEYDIQTTIYSLLNSFTASPWDRWDIVVGWPDLTTPGDSTSKVSASFDPTCYVMEAIKLNEINQVGGGVPTNLYSMIIGFWLQRRSGGSKEMSQWISEMLYLFQRPATIHAVQFDLTLGTTDYVNTTLTAQKLYVQRIDADSRDMSDDRNEFRREITLTLKA